MSSNNIDNHEMKNNKENNKQKNDNKIDNNIQDTNDNETNQIIKESDNMNESDNLKTNTNSKKDKVDLNFVHDKDITDDSVIYFSNKLIDYNKSYKLFLYISIILYFIDIIIWFKNVKILHNYFNMFSLIIVLSSNIYQAYIFRHNFETITKELFIFVSKIIYVNIICFIIYILNIIYIFISKILEIVEIKYIYENKVKQNIIVIIYCIINICIPSIHFYKLIYIKKGIKDLSLAKGEIYESDKIGDVEIIQSVINEI